MLSDGKNMGYTLDKIKKNTKYVHTKDTQKIKKRKTAAPTHLPVRTCEPIGENTA